MRAALAIRSTHARQDLAAIMPMEAAQPRLPGRLRRVAAAAALAAVCVLASGAVQAQPADSGLVTRPSAHSVPATLQRFAAAVQAEGWVVFTEIDHAAAATAAGLSLKPRTVVLFGNPRAGTPAMAEHPTLAIDLPMRVLVWQDDLGRTFVTRSTGADIGTRVFGRHGIPLPPPAQQGTEAFIGALVLKATE